MATIKKFEDLRSWQTARVLVKEVYLVSRNRAFSNDFGLRNQMRRAAVSIMSNIAEGFNRNSPKEFIRFLEISLSSANEVKSLLYVTVDLEYLDHGKVTSLQKEAESVKAMNFAMIRYLKNSNIESKRKKKP